MRVITRYMKIPKIWRICVQQLKKDYYYTSLSIDYLKLRKLCCDSLNNYKIVQIKNYHSNFYRNRTKIFIFKKYRLREKKIFTDIFARPAKIYAL